MVTRAKGIMGRLLRLSALLLILSTLLSAAACGDGDVLTVDEIFQVFKKSGNGRLTVTTTAQTAAEDGSVTVRQTQMASEKAGNLAHAVRNTLTVTGGVPNLSSTEIYQRQSGGMLISAMRTDGGEWRFSRQVATENDGFSYGDIFRSSHFQSYDRENHRYVGKEGLSVEVDGAVYTDLLVEIGDGSYTMSANYTAADGASCTLSLTYSDVGKVELTLPDDLQGKL